MAEIWEMTFEEYLKYLVSIGTERDLIGRKKTFEEYLIENKIDPSSLPTEQDETDVTSYLFNPVLDDKDKIIGLLKYVMRKKELVLIYEKTYPIEILKKRPFNPDNKEDNIFAKDTHKAGVMNAILLDKDIPSSVLLDYPDIVLRLIGSGRNFGIRASFPISPKIPLNIRNKQD